MLTPKKKRIPGLSLADNVIRRIPVREFRGTAGIQHPSRSLLMLLPAIHAAIQAYSPHNT